MRVKKTFGERTTSGEVIEVKRKYFIVFEGEVTEEQYFDGINNNKQLLNIDSIIDIKPILRSFGEVGWSNPKKLLDRLLDFIKESETVSKFV